MARTLAEIDADLAALETQVSDMVTQTEANTARLSKLIRALKAVVKRIKPNGVPPNPFDPYAAAERMEKIRQMWMAMANNETDDLDDA